MNKHVLKSSQLYVHLVRQKKFKKKNQKIAITQDDPLKTSAIKIVIKKSIDYLFLVKNFFCNFLRAYSKESCKLHNQKSNLSMLKKMHKSKKKKKRKMTVFTKKFVIFLIFLY